VTATDALSTCNSCDGPVEEPNAGGYCDACRAGAEISTRTGLRIWSACACEDGALRCARRWSEGGNTFEVALREDLSPARPWVVYADADADTVAGRWSLD